MKKFVRIASAAVSATLLTAFAANVWASGDIAAGKVAAEKYGCVACHGVDFKSPIDPTYPKLAGQHKDYLAHSLVAYQRGKDAPNGRANAIMNGQAKALTPKDIDNLAAYIHSLPGDLTVRK